MTVIHFCRESDLNGLGKVRPCMRVLMCGMCKRPLVADAPTCGECSYCLKRIQRRDGKWWASQRVSGRSK